jgi:hypothetical protein
METKKKTKCSKTGHRCLAENHKISECDYSKKCTIYDGCGYCAFAGEEECFNQDAWPENQNKEKEIMNKKPKIITICGSSRYIEIMAALGWLLEKIEGAIVFNLHLLPWWYETECKDHIAEHEGVSREMDDLHLEKINISDEVFIVNWDDYIGNSTKNEISHATHINKTIRYITEEKTYLHLIFEMIDKANRKD